MDEELRTLERQAKAGDEAARIRLRRERFRRGEDVGFEAGDLVEHEADSIDNVARLAPWREVVRRTLPESAVFILSESLARSCSSHTLPGHKWTLIEPFNGEKA